MGSPPPPAFSKPPFERRETTRPQITSRLDHKTPRHQPITLAREFKSEYQPRVSNRHSQQEPPAVAVVASVAAPTLGQGNDMSKSFLNRIRSTIKPPQSAASQNLKTHSTQDTRFASINKLGPIATTTKAPFLISQYTQPTPSSNKSTLYQATKATPSAAATSVPAPTLGQSGDPTKSIVERFRSTIKPPQSEAPQHLRAHLIQDTRFAPINRFGPIATATKAPLSVSQYTQPTPSSNKSASHQVSRAYSEPSIKYQVKVNDKTYKVLRKIGSGGSAKVYEGFEPTTYQSVAIKIINVAKADQRTQESYFNERAILTQLKDSKHVVKIYNSEYKSEIKELVIVMEKGDADLSQVLDYYFKSRDQPGMIDGIFIKFYWRGMLMAVNEIHQHGIVHADLKPVNFILVKNQIKLIDFGIASTVDPGGTSVIRDYQIGTINYMAPEALRNRALDASFISQSTNDPLLLNDFQLDENNQQQPSAKKTVIKYNSKADIWSLGCILYNFVYGRPPFDKYSDIVSKVQAIINPRQVINFPEINNVHLMNCMKLCLRYNPTDRPTAEQLLNHDYLKSDLICITHE